MRRRCEHNKVVTKTELLIKSKVQKNIFLKFELFCKTSFFFKLNDSERALLMYPLESLSALCSWCTEASMLKDRILAMLALMSPLKCSEKRSIILTQYTFNTVSVCMYVCMYVYICMNVLYVRIL